MRLDIEAFSVGRRVLARMAEIEQRLHRKWRLTGEDLTDDLNWATHPDACEYRRLMCQWWQLPSSETTEALNWAYCGGLTRYGLPEIHNRLVTSRGRVIQHKDPAQLRLTPTERKVQRFAQRLRGSGGKAQELIGVPEK